MAYNGQRELIKRAVIIATDKHPDGYTKAQLVESSKEVFGGYGADPYKPVKTHEEASHYSNYLSEIDGGYPRGLDTCFAVGISGNCGIECEQFADGGCETPLPNKTPEQARETATEVIELYGEKDGVAILESYGEFEDYLNDNYPNGLEDEAQG